MKLLERLRSQISLKFKKFNYIFHTESKEWLIQTIINEDTGFHDDITDNDIYNTISEVR